MAGLLGFLPSRKIDTTEKILSAMQKTMHFDGLGCKILSANDQSAHGAVFHLRDQGAVKSIQFEGLTVIAFGQLFNRGKLVSQANLIELAKSIRTHGIKIADHLDGSYQLVVVDEASQTFHLQNDRLGSLPLFYNLQEDGFSYGPEAKSILTGKSLNPKLNIDAAIAFLRDGYSLTKQTIFSDITRLPPGTRVTYELTRKNLEVEKYWTLHYRPDPKIQKRKAIDELFELTKIGHQLATDDSPDEFGVFLTGGVDSRGIAASLQAIERLPQTSLTWCGIPDMVGSDPWIAKLIAKKFQFPNRTVVLDSDSFAEHAKDWLFVSELTTDNPGFCLAPLEVFNNEVPKSLKHLLVGDELFGHGCDAGSITSAIQYVIKSYDRPLDKWLRNCLSSNAMTCSDQVYEEHVSELTEACGTNHPRDIVDHLTYYVHRPCWSFSAGNCKEPAIPVRRPYLYNDIVDFVTKLPRNFRDDKVVYFEMLKKHLPISMTFPRTTADSLFDWANAFHKTPSLGNLLKRGLFSGSLLDGPLADSLDADSVKKLADQFFDNPPKKMKRNSYLHHAVNLRRQMTQIPFLGDRVRAMSQRLLKQKRKSVSLESITLLRRLASLGLFIETIEEGRFTN